MEEKRGKGKLNILVSSENRKTFNTSNKKNKNTINKIINNLLLISLFVVFAYSVVAQAQPTIIALQGKLTNESTGALITNADIRVNISSPTGTTLWNETYVNGVSSGFFDLLLGTNADNPLNLTFNQDYNISIYVGDSQTQIGGTYRFRGGQGRITPSNLSGGNFTAEGNFSFGSTLFIDKTNDQIAAAGLISCDTIDTDENGVFQCGTDDSGIAAVDINNTDINVTNFVANQTLFVNGSRVGIGTVPHPSYIADITGHVRLDGNLYISANSGVGRDTANSALTLWGGSSESNGGIIVLHGESQATRPGDILFRSSTTELAIIKAGGNVGIGNSIPNNTLDVSGNVNLTGAVSFPALANCDTIDTDAAGVLSCGTDDTGGAGVDNNSLWNLTGNNIFTSDFEGNVGIGTIAPTHTLTVSGATNTSTLIANDTLFVNSSRVAIGNPQQLDYLTVGAPGQSDGSLTITGHTASAATNKGTLNFVERNSETTSVQIQAIAGPAGWTTDTGQLIISTYDTSLVERVRVMHDGKVGINNSDPNYVLDVGGSINASALNLTQNMRVGSLQSCTAIETDSEGNFICGTDDTGGAGADNNSLWNQTGNDIYTSDFDGNVGIGETDPNWRLVVTGSTGVNITNTGSGDSFIVNDASGDTTAFRVTASGVVQTGTHLNVTGNTFIGANLKIGSQVENPTHNLVVTGSTGVNFTNTGSGASLIVNDQSGDTTPFVVDGSGNVGILNRNPTWPLNVHGGINISTSTNGYFFYIPHSTSPFVIESGGDVGIGTSNPAYQLHVSGGDIALNQTSTTNLDGTVMNTIHFLTGDGSNGVAGEAASIHSEATGAHAGTDIPTALVFSTSETTTHREVERMRIDDEGLVGIGNSNPNFKLDVNGTINSSTVTAQTIQVDGNDVNHSLLALSQFEDDIGASLSADAVGVTELDDGSDTASNDDVVMIDNGDNSQFIYIDIPDCDDGAGTLNYNTGDQSFSCGTAALAGATNDSLWNQSGNDIFNSDFDGNVGIGTRSPTHDLQVVGDVNVSGSINATIIQVEGNDVNHSVDLSSYSEFGASVDDTEMTNEDFGDFSCDGNEDGCTVDSGAIDSTALAADAVAVADLDDGSDTATNDDVVMIDNGDNSQFIYIDVPDCDDGAGTLNYDTSSQAFSCGTAALSSSDTQATTANHFSNITLYLGGSEENGSLIRAGNTTWVQGVSVGGDTSGTIGSITVTDDSHNHVLANIDEISSGIGSEDMEAAEDFGDFTCDGNDGGCTIDTDALNADEIQDIYVLIAGDSMTGNLVVGDASGEGIDIGTTGVRITGDQDGALTFLGLGNGNDENLIMNLDDTANTVVFSSGTSVSEIDFSGINLDTSGTVDAGEFTEDGSTTLTNSISGNAATATALAANPADCGAGDFATTIAANGDLTCASISGSDVSDDGTYVLVAGDSMTGNLVVGDASGEGIDIGTTGVRITSDQDGALTFLGLGNGNDENLIINFDDTANVITFTTGTSVGELDFAAMNLDTSGTVDAGEFTEDGSTTLSNSISGTAAVASDLSCTNCIGETEITDVYIVNNADDSTTGALTVNDNDGTDNENKLIVGDSNDLDNIIAYGRIGVGTASPAADVEVTSTRTAESGGGNISLTSVEGTVDEDDLLGAITFKGTDSAIRAGAYIQAVAYAGWGSDQQDAPTNLTFHVQSDGNTGHTRPPRMVLGGDGSVIINLGLS